MFPFRAFPRVRMDGSAGRSDVLPQKPGSFTPGRRLPGISLLAAVIVAAPAMGSPAPRKILFFDDVDVLSRMGTKRELHVLEKIRVMTTRNSAVPGRPPVSYNAGLLPYYGLNGNTAMNRRNWEAQIGFTSVHRNPQTGLYQLWYQGYTSSKSGDKRKGSVINLATSTDGINWIRPGIDAGVPGLGKFDFVENIDLTNKVFLPPTDPKYKYHEASKTNIVLIGSGGYGDRYGVSVYVEPGNLDPNDPNPNKRPDRRYKMVHTDWAYSVKDTKAIPQEIDEHINDPSSLPHNADYKHWDSLANPYHDGDNVGSGTQIAFSPDGVNWTKLAAATGEPGFPGPAVVHPISFGAVSQPPTVSAHAETPNDHRETATGRHWWDRPITMSDAQDVFYDPVRGKFVITGKMHMFGPTGKMSWKHAMGWMESEDFVHWEKPEMVDFVRDRDSDVTKFHTSPVFHYEGMYLCLNQIYTQPLYTGTDDHGTLETIDIELMTSRNGKRWDRHYIGQPILPRGDRHPTDPPGEGDHNLDFDAQHIFTNSTPVILENEMRFYYGAYGFKSGVGMARIGRDRIVGLRSDHASGSDTIGQVTLKPIDLSGYQALAVNAKVEAGGEVRVELLNAEGKLLVPHLKGSATPLTGDPPSGPDSVSGDPLSRKVRWGALSLPAQQTCLIRIHLKNAELFSVSLLP